MPKFTLVKTPFLNSRNGHPLPVRDLIVGGVPTTFGGMFLDPNSYAWAWGWNYSFGYHSVGDNTTNQRSFPVSVVGGKQWWKLGGASGFYGGTYSALDANSYAWAWGGQNTSGQLGANNIGLSASPVSVVGGRQFWWLRSGPGHSIALDQYSYAWCWGFNDRGQLGDGTTLWRSSPVSVLGGRQWQQAVVTTGLGNTWCTIGIDSLGYAWAWGWNSGSLVGTLGDNSITDRSSPVSVVGNRRFLTVTTTQWFVHALDVNSYAWAWGGNQGTYAGALGDNSATTRSSPVSVVGGRQFTTIVNNFYGGAGLDGNSYAWAWGPSGVAGDNTITTRSSPVSVVGGLQFKTLVSAGLTVFAQDGTDTWWAWSVATENQRQGYPISVSSPVSTLFMPAPVKTFRP